MTLKFTPAPHRYWLDGKPIPGVTTLIGKGLPKPALPNWAARSAAEYVADNLEVLNALPDRESIIATVKQSPWTARDRAAVRGTDVHALAEELIHGRDVDVPEHLADYVSGYVRWLDLWEPEVILTERPVANRHWWYAGKFDVIYRLRDGRVVLADNKTSKGVYGETALQLAAYNGAEFFAAEDGSEQPLPETDGLAVIHITPSGTDLYPVNDPAAAWKDWTHVLWTAKAEQRIKDQISDLPAEPPSVAS